MYCKKNEYAELHNHFQFKMVYDSGKKNVTRNNITNVSLTNVN